MESINAAGVLLENLTQGPASDPRCQLIFSSLVTILHLLDRLICTRNVMSIVLLQMMGEWDKWRVVHLYQGVGGGTGGGYHLIVFFLVFLFSNFRRRQSLYLRDQGMMDIVSVSLLFSLFSLNLVPLTRSYWWIEAVVSVV